MTDDLISRAAAIAAMKRLGASGDLGVRVWFEHAEKVIAALPAQPAQGEAVGRCKVPPGQTPLNDKLSHPLLDVISEGSAARDTGAGSPYHGHSLEHCLHATGWVQRDLRLALDAKTTPTPPDSAGELDALVSASADLCQFVEGIDGAMNHGTWRDEKGARLKDTQHWVVFYNAYAALRAKGVR